MDKRQFLRTGLLGTGCLLCTSGRQVLAGITGEQSAMADNDRWTREALFYSETPRGVKCLICPNECTLKPGELSDCRNRINRDGKLYTIAYGNPCAVHIDPIEKKPLYHFLPSTQSFSIATAGCNLACLNCQNWTISQSSPTETRNVDLMPDNLVKQALNNDCRTIAYTYSEPITFFEYTCDSSKLAHEQGVRNILVSAGYINPEPQHHLIRYIDGANIDLKSFSEEIYLKLNGGKLKPVLEGLKVFREEGVWLEITNLIVPGWTDDMVMIARMCDWLFENGFRDVPLHFSRFHPTYKLTQIPPTPVSTLEKAKETALAAGLRFVYIGNVPGSSASNTYCPECGEIVIERKGFRITQNNLKAGKCASCSEPIPGVWE
ncbi:AmmeMemoRadiSam system radical SAM enzyme [Bacteroidota bacterium]